MIEKLQIKDFQRHDHLSIELDPQITAVTGASDSGKSSMLRALRWLALNRPLGDGFVRIGAEGAAVRLKVDGRRLERKKKGSDNSYAVDGKTLRSFGTDVPEEIQNVLKIGEVNFQGQHEPAFWFALTPGEVAKRLNEIVDLGEIDRVTAELAAMARKGKAAAEVVEERLAGAERELAGLDYVPELEGELEGLEEREADKASRTALAARLGESLREAVVCRDRASGLSGAKLGGLRAVSLGSAASGARERADGLRSLLAEAVGLRKTAKAEVPGMCGLDALKDRAEGLATKVRRLGSFVKSLRDDYEWGVADLYNKLTEARERLDEETEGVCPICGGELK